MPEFIDAHGIAIVYNVHPAEGTPRGVVQLLHGVGEHAGRYAALIAALTADGSPVVLEPDTAGRIRLVAAADEPTARALLDAVG